MKCEDPSPEGTYEECQLDLGHSGDHEYFGKKWPRLERGELAPDVEALIDAGVKARNTWDLNERQYPIVVEVTSVYVINAPGETEDEALSYWDGGDFPDLDGEQAIDGGFEIRRVDQWQRTGLTGAPIGPQIACPDCGRQAMHREWYHDPFRRCHGPIQWRENTNARALKWRYSREHHATPMAVTA